MSKNSIISIVIYIVLIAFANLGVFLEIGGWIDVISNVLFYAFLVWRLLIGSDKGNRWIDIVVIVILFLFKIISISGLFRSIFGL
jgi:hypothetical protein